MTSFRIFIGTYTRDKSQGIYSVQLDAATGGFTTPELAAKTANPSYLAFSPRRDSLYAVSESEAMAVAFRVQPDRTHLEPLSDSQNAGGHAPCHLSADHTGRTLVVANYHTGVVASLPIKPNGALGPVHSLIQHHGASVNPARQSSPHAHSVTVSPDNRFVLACDLGLDKIFTYRLDAGHATLSAAIPPFTAATPGTGPRHFAFSPNGELAFVIGEITGTLTSYRYDKANGSLRALDEQSTLHPPPKVENRSAAVRVHPNGRFVYASNRGADDIAVFAVDAATGRLTWVENTPTGGKGPRDFSLSPDGRWIVVANQDSNSLTSFTVSAETGRLTRASGQADLSMPVCVLFAD
jgi:6-phosphogluconolactonase